MLYADNTKHGGGITLWGDVWDLRQAQQVIYDLAGEQCPLWRGEQSNIVLGLAYDIRHAHEGQRKKDTQILFEEEKAIYGVDVLWPTVLLQLALMRRAAGFMPTDAYTQATLYALEACVHSALRAFCPSSADTVLDITIAIANGPLDPLLDAHPTRAAYFASLNSLAQRRAALPAIMNSHHAMYDQMYPLHAQAGNAQGLIDPAVFDNVDTDQPKFHW